MAKATKKLVEAPKEVLEDNIVVNKYGLYKLINAVVQGHGSQYEVGGGINKLSEIFIDLPKSEQKSKYDEIRNFITEKNKQKAIMNETPITSTDLALPDSSLEVVKIDETEPTEVLPELNDKLPETENVNV